jgi:hypothetical protein
MPAIVRRSEGIDKVRSEDVTSKVGESLVPALRKVPGFSGCYVFDAGEGVFTSMAHESRGEAVTDASQRSPRAPRTSSQETAKVSDR